MELVLTEETRNKVRLVAEKLGLSTEDLLCRAIEGLFSDTQDGVYPPDEIIAIRAMQDPDAAPVLSDEEMKQYKLATSLEDFMKNAKI